MSKEKDIMEWFRAQTQVAHQQANADMARVYAVRDGMITGLYMAECGVRERLQSGDLVRGDDAEGLREALASKGGPQMVYPEEHADTLNYLRTFRRLFEAHLEALTRVIVTAADKGSHAAVEEVADYLNACDAVLDGDAEVYQRWANRPEVAAYFAEPAEPAEARESGNSPEFPPQLTETLAQLVWGAMRTANPKAPLWQPGGNSDMQDHARKVAHLCIKAMRGDGGAA